MNTNWKSAAIGFAFWFVFLGLPGIAVMHFVPGSQGLVVFFTVIVPQLVVGCRRLINPVSRRQLLDSWVANPRDSVAPLRNDSTF